MNDPRPDSLVARRDLAVAVHAAGVAGVDPRSATARGVAAAMAEAAITTLRDHGVDPSGGVIVAPADGPSPHRALTVLVGDHPTPNAGSRAAANAVAALAEQIAGVGTVFVLLSGGATSLDTR